MVCEDQAPMDLCARSRLLGTCVVCEGQVPRSLFEDLMSLLKPLSGFLGSYFMQLLSVCFGISCSASNLAVLRLLL